MEYENLFSASQVYERIGMALVSAQRVEFLTSKILEYLVDFSEDYKVITSTEFLDNSANAKKARKTLGQVFALLKLNPHWVIEDELNAYLKKRNLLVHEFWQTHLNSTSQKHSRDAIAFCNEFGTMSENVERFFKGFLFFLALRYVEDRDHLDSEIKKWGDDFEYFITALKNKHPF
jgi:hypothetical protein